MNGEKREADLHLATREEGGRSASGHQHQWQNEKMNKEGRAADAAIRPPAPAVVTEAIAADEGEVAEGGEGASEEGEVGVRDGHPLEVEALEPGVGGGEGGEPRGEAGASPIGDEVEVGEAGLAFEDEHPDSAEPLNGIGRGDGVVVFDEELTPGLGLTRHQDRHTREATFWSRRESRN